MMKGVMAATLAALVGATSAAAAGYPDHPIRFIVPFPPGGSGDLVGRVVATQMSTTLGQSFVIENHPGAGGRLGVDLLAKAAPDGYTVGIGTLSTLGIAPAVYKTLPYDPRRSFQPIGMLMDSPVIMVVNPAVPAHSVAEFVALAKAKPGKLNYGTLGPGTVHHFSAEDFSLLTGIHMVQVPYTGAGPAIVGLLSDEVQLMFDNLASFRLQNITTGRLRALVVASKTRLPQLPDVPSAPEAGLPDFDVSAWFALLAPAGTPKAAIVRLNTALKAAMAAAPVRKVFAEQAMILGGGTPDAVAAKIDTEIKRWSKVVAATGFTPQ
jgi:tripartite-type tricarboxylate transporter receptor subunit TctC